MQQPLLAADEAGNPEAISLSNAEGGHLLSNRENSASSVDQSSFKNENKLDVVSTELLAVDFAASHSSIQYQPLLQSDPYTDLYSFLNPVGINRGDILQVGISEPH